MSEQFTEKQAKAWEEDVAPILEAHGVSRAMPGQLFGHWMVEWAEESRPGRGHHFNGIYVDGEVTVQVLMDVYGYPSVSVAELDWVHADSDEELHCSTCHKHSMRFEGRDSRGRMVFYCDSDCGFEHHVDLWKKTRVENVPDPKGLLGPIDIDKFRRESA